MRGFLAAAVIIAGTPTLSQAAGTFMSGNELLRTCTSEEPVLQAQCAGFVAGVADLQGTVRMAGNYAPCLPAGTEVRQVRDAVVQFLQQYPALRTSGGALMVTSAIAKNWKCPDSPMIKPGQLPQN